MPHTCDYRLDKNDRIVEVNAEFLEFAKQNEAAELAGVRGTSIWDHIQDETTRRLYKDLFAWVRCEGESITIPFRCDSPALRRHMELTIGSVADQGLRLTAAFLRVEPRPPLEIFDRRHPRSEERLKACSFCCRIFVPERGWQSAEEAIGMLKLFSATQLPRLTHDVCPACLPNIREHFQVAPG